MWTTHLVLILDGIRHMHTLDRCDVRLIALYVAAVFMVGCIIVLMQCVHYKMQDAATLSVALRRIATRSCTSYSRHPETVSLLFV